MPSKLSIYNGALTILGERPLASLTDDLEARYKCDDVWDNDFVKRVLEMGQWNFAARTVELTYSPSVTPSFGYVYAFDKPIDFVRTMQICQDEYMTQPLTHYSDESKFWFADLEDIYAQYVSFDTQFGGDFSLWPYNFTEMAEHYMAFKLAPRLTGMDFDSIELEAKWKRWLAEAKATDAMEAATKFIPQGSWAGSRRGFRKGERGKRNQLIG